MTRLLIAALLALLPLLGLAQTVPGSATLTWTLPTVSPANALTGVEVHWSTAPILDTDLTRVAQVTLPGTAVTTAQTIPVTNGQTLYFRLRAVNATGKSGYSNQASKLIDVPQAPGVPTSLTVTLIINTP